MSSVRSPLILLIFALATLVASLGHAADGVIGLNHACATQTGCLEGDDPGFPIQIAKPGSYRLTGNIVDHFIGGPLIPSIGILVESPGVSIDLAGFTLRNTCMEDESCSNSEVSFTVGILHVDTALRVSNGTVGGFGASIVSAGQEGGILLGRNLRLSRASHDSTGNGSNDAGGSLPNSGVLCTRCNLREALGGLLLHDVEITGARWLGDSMAGQGIVLDGIRLEDPKNPGAFPGAPVSASSSGAVLHRVVGDHWHIAGGCVVMSDVHLRRSPENLHAVILSAGLIVDSSLVDSQATGVVVVDSVLVRRTTVSGSDGAAFFGANGTISIFDSQANDNGSGVTLESTGSVLVGRSSIDGNGGLGVGSGRGQVFGSTLRGNTAAGIALSDSGRAVGNTVTDTTGGGLILTTRGGQSENTLSGNTVDLSGGFPLGSSLCGTNLTCP